MKTTAILLIGAITLTAGCATGTPPLPITSEPTNIGVLASFPAERLRPSTTMTVRTFDQRGETPVEVAGLTCEMSSNELTGSVVTPAQINVPAFDQSGRLENRGRPDQILIACNGNGLSGNLSVVAVDKQLVTDTSMGLAGVLLSTAVSAAVASSTSWKLPTNVAVGVR